MAQISLTFPDGNSRDFEAGITPAEVAAGISSGLNALGTVPLCPMIFSSLTATSPNMVISE